MKIGKTVEAVTVEMIATYNKGNQATFNLTLPLTTEAALRKTILDGERGGKRKLLKISACVLNSDGKNLPNWFLKANGKFNF